MDLVERIMEWVLPGLREWRIAAEMEEGEDGPTVARILERMERRRAAA